LFQEGSHVSGDESRVQQSRSPPETWGPLGRTNRPDQYVTVKPDAVAKMVCAGKRLSTVWVRDAPLSASANGMALAGFDFSQPSAGSNDFGKTASPYSFRD
jgi:hypothetical protein